MLGPFVKPLEIVGRVIEVLAPVIAKPADVALDRIDIFLLLFGRIGIVETKVTAAAELLGHTEIEPDRLGMADMQIAIRLRRKTRHHRRVPLGSEVGPDDVADEVLPRLPNRRIVDCHASKAPIGALCGKSACVRQGLLWYAAL